MLMLMRSLSGALLGTEGALIADLTTWKEQSRQHVARVLRAENTTTNDRIVLWSH